MHIITVANVPLNEAGQSCSLAAIMQQLGIVGVYDTARLFVQNNAPDSISTSKINLLPAVSQSVAGTSIDSETGPDGGETAVNIVAVPYLTLVIETAEANKTCTAIVTLAHSMHPSKRVVHVTIKWDSPESVVA